MLKQIWTDCDEAEDYVVPNVLSPRDLVFRPGIMDETVKSSCSNKMTALTKPDAKQENLFVVKMGEKYNQ